MFLPFIYNFISMSNSWFAFKQFKINQDKTAMKVGTDGVLLGAWVDVVNVETALDIGTGTGLIALMMAQRNSRLKVDAIDIEESACEQAEENFDSSPWSERLTVKHQSLKQYADETGCKYDVIVCNPPYFTNGVKAGDEKRRIARHADELTLDELFEQSNRLLNDSGRLNLVYPHAGYESLVFTAGKYGLFPEVVVHVRPIAGKDFVRVLISLSKSDAGNFKESELTIETDRRHFYTVEFKRLVEDFYLNVK